VLEKELSAEKGGFSFFGLLQRVGIKPGSTGVTALPEYDLVVAAPWLDANSDVHLQNLIATVQHALTVDEWRRISAVVILPVNHPGIIHMNEFIETEHSDIHQENNIVDGFKLRSGQVITSKRR